MESIRQLSIELEESQSDIAVTNDQITKLDVNNSAIINENEQQKKKLDPELNEELLADELVQRNELFTNT